MWVIHEWCTSFSEHLECRSSLGMENGNITDTQITAPSEWRITGDYLHAYQGRLHLKTAGVMKGAWAAGRLDVNQWLQVDLRSYNARVTGVATQGRQDGNMWVTKYKLQFSFVNLTKQPASKPTRKKAKIKKRQVTQFFPYLFSYHESL